MERETTANRLKKIMSDDNLRQIDILNRTIPYCEKYGVKMNKSDISQYCSGKTEPNQEKLFVLGMALNVNEAWLMGFDVPKERSTPEGFKCWDEQYNAGHEQLTLNKQETELVKAYRFLDQYGKETINYILNRESTRMLVLLKKDKRISELEAQSTTIIDFNNVAKTSERTIQYFHSVSAGTGQVIFDDVYSERISIPDIPKYRRVAYAVKVSGCSMEPLYENGDMLLVEPTCEIEIGEIGIFNVDGQAFVKKLGDQELISLNSDYSNIVPTENSRCMGRVIDKYRPNTTEPDKDALEFAHDILKGVNKESESLG